MWLKMKPIEQCPRSEKNKSLAFPELVISHKHNHNQPGRKVPKLHIIKLWPTTLQQPAQEKKPQPLLQSAPNGYTVDNDYQLLFCPWWQLRTNQRKACNVDQSPMVLHFHLAHFSISRPIPFLSLRFFSPVKPSHSLPVSQSLLNKCNGSWPSCNKIWINRFSTGLSDICLLSQSKNKNTFIITFKQLPLKSRAKQEQSFPHLIQHITVSTKHYVNKKNKGNNDLIRGLKFSLFANAWLLM